MENQVLGRVRCDEEFRTLPFTPLASFHWEKATPYRPRTEFRVARVGETLTAELRSFEKAPRTAFFQRDDPVYRDSCLEFFVAAVPGRKEYLNIECNSRGVFLCEFGEGKYNRVLLSALTKETPCVTPFSGEEAGEAYWGVNIVLGKPLICALYGLCEDAVDFAEIRANFYKCGDDCAVPHYLAFSPVTTLPPGFHNPACFAVFRG